MDFSSISNMLKVELARIEGLHLAAKAMAEVGSLEQAAKEMIDRHAAVTADLASTTAAVAAAKTELDTVKTQAATTAAAADEHAKGLLESAKAEYAKIVAEARTEASSLHAQFAAERAKLKADWDREIAVFTSKKTQLQTDVTNGEAALAAVQAKVSNAATQLADIKAAASKIL